MKIRSDNPIFQCYVDAMIERTRLTRAIETALRRSPVVALLGPRQSGKTTLARAIATTKKTAYFDLESPADLRALEQPMTALEGLSGLVVLDEVQRCPELMPILRVLADRNPLPARFLILGSASPDLVKGSSETLAGRVEFVDIAGFTLDEVGASHLDKLWVRGGLPRSYLARTDADSTAWRESFARTFLERDLPALGIGIPAATLQRFWMMIAHAHGQTWNASDIGRSLGLSDKTVRNYLDIFTGTYMTRQLPPWFENISKRQVKAPKVYLRDSGLLHALLGLETRANILTNPRCGASWEGFAIEQLLAKFGERQAYFWSTHSEAELDLFLIRGAERWGFELKLNDAPTMTRSLHTAIADLKLSRVWLIYPGKRSYAVAPKVTALPLQEIENL